MSIAWRIEYEEALYRLIYSGAVLSDIFIDKVDRNGFLDTNEEMAEYFDIYAFA
jgi:hypothetical protein